MSRKNRSDRVHLMVGSPCVWNGLSAMVHRVSVSSVYVVPVGDETGMWVSRESPRLRALLAAPPKREEEGGGEEDNNCGIKALMNTFDLSHAGASKYLNPGETSFREMLNAVTAMTGERPPFLCRIGWDGDALRTVQEGDLPPDCLVLLFESGPPDDDGHWIGFRDGVIHDGDQKCLVDWYGKRDWIVYGVIACARSRKEKRDEVDKKARVLR